MGGIWGGGIQSGTCQDDVRPDTWPVLNSDSDLALYMGD